MNVHLYIKEHNHIFVRGLMDLGIAYYKQRNILIILTLQVSPPAP